MTVSLRNAMAILYVLTVNQIKFIGMAMVYVQLWTYTLVTTTVKIADWISRVLGDRMTMEQLQPIDRFINLLEYESKQKHNGNNYSETYGFLYLYICDYFISIHFNNFISCRINKRNSGYEIGYKLSFLKDRYEITINDVTFAIPKHMIDNYF